MVKCRPDWLALVLDVLGERLAGKSNWVLGEDIFKKNVVGKADNGLAARGWIGQRSA